MKPTGSQTVESLRASGHMVLILTPTELGGVDPHRVENALQNSVADVIESLFPAPPLRYAQSLQDSLMAHLNGG